MTTPTAGTAPEAQTRPWRPTFSRAEIGFLTAVPLVWAVVLLFHGAPDGADVYGSLRDEASRYLIVHLVSLVFLGLMGAALYLLLRGLPGRAAQNQPAGDRAVRRVLRGRRRHRGGRDRRAR
jgi:hypothetical protein